MATPTIQIHRKKEVLKRAGFGPTTLHKRIKEGLFVPPIRLGARAVGWIESEYNQVLAFMAAGKSDLELRELVSQLVEQRKDLAA